MRILSKARDRAQQAAHLIRACTSSRAERVQRGLAYRNLFLTGSEDGTPQTFLRMHDYIQDIKAFLFNPADLRFAIDYFGTVSPVERAKGMAAASALHQHVTEAEVDEACSEATLWALIKGKTIQQTVWSRNGFEPYLIQPEAFGVYNESISSLERQECFVHSTFPTRSRFAQIISVLPIQRQRELFKAVDSVAIRTREGEDHNNVLKQVIVGGLYPYTTSGSPAQTSGGMVTHLFAPQASMEAGVVDSLVPMDELWVWNDEQDDWATITMVGDHIVFGENELFNAFSSNFRPTVPNDKNPLTGKHGFVEFSPLPLHGYFWGVSYVYLTALLQRSINKRIDGINIMLRKQEDPPRFMSGSTIVNQNAYAKLNRPGGYFTDGSPNAKIQDLAKEVPTDIWRSFHELNSMFDIIAGTPAVTRGEGEGSVRSQGHAETLLRTGAARHKDAALKIERSVSNVGGLCLSMLQAKSTDPLVAWVAPGVKSIEIDKEPDPSLEPPVEGMQPVTFQFRHLSSRARVGVDGHSSSPAFSEEARQLAFALNRIGAASPQRVIEMTHPPQEDALIEDIERRDIAQAELVKAHPELAFPHGKGHGKAH
jgi:hypothetical protein